MRFFIDECVSPSLSRHLNETGLHDAIHPRDRARLRGPDYVVFARAIAEHRIIVTGRFAQARRRRRSHPVLIILPSVARLEAQRLMDLVIDHLVRLKPERPQDALIRLRQSRRRG